MPPERLQKVIAKAGIASRREAEEMIRAGRVTINGKIVTELGTKADPAADHVKVDGKLITRNEAPRYILMYKPKEVMTTLSDPQGRKTVLDLIRGIKERIFPVGRLDFNSEGLILLTNDGELAYKVAHPSHGAIKTYHVKVRGVPEERMVEKLRRGITIEGRRTFPCDMERLRTTGRSTGRTEEEGNSWFEVKLGEGRTQQIRKMFQAIGHPVTKLRRVAIGPLSDPGLLPGQWRELTRQEIRMLTDPEARPKRVTKRPSVRKTKTAPTSASSKKATSTRRGPRNAPAASPPRSRARRTR